MRFRQPGIRMNEQSPAPISGELRDAFCVAIGQYGDWRRGVPEPEISLNSESSPISTVCDAVSKFEDTMPDHLWVRLVEVMPGSEDLPHQRSYGSAALHLARLVRERKEQFARPYRGD